MPRYRFNGILRADRAGLWMSAQRLSDEVDSVSFNENFELDLSRWNITAGDPQRIAYGASGFLDVAVSNLIDGGGWFCYGGSASLSEMHTSIAIPEALALAPAALSLSAALGGYDTQADDVIVTAEFLNSYTGLISSSVLGPVTPAERGYLYTLVPRAITADVPADARYLRLRITFTKYAGGSNDGVIDNLRATIAPA